MRWNIIAVQGHYEVYSMEGIFLFSADTKAEISEEWNDWQEERIA